MLTFSLACVLGGIFLLLSLVSMFVHDKITKEDYELALKFFGIFVLCFFIALDVSSDFNKWDAKVKAAEATGVASVTNAQNLLRQEAISNGAAHYETSKEGVLKFVWDGKNPPQVEKKN